MLGSLKQQIARYLFYKFRKQETKLHELKYLFWECTTRCNLNCLHCGSDCSKDSKYQNMPFTDFEASVDTIKSSFKPITVVFTGGEPLLRKDIEECGLKLRKKGFRWGIVSNGYHYTKERQNTLLNAGMGALTLSLDGLKKNHNWLRNNPKSYDKVVQAIELASSAKRLNFDIVTCINKRNIHELEELYELLKSKNVKAWRLFTIAPIGRAKDNDELLLNSNQLKQLMNFIKEKRQVKIMDVKFSCEGYVGNYETKVRDGYFFCRAGINIGSVLIDGSISACPNIDRSFAQGNIYQNNFNEIWEKQFSEMRDRNWMKTGICTTCKEFTYCMGNGMHYRIKDQENTLFCHFKHLQ